MIVVTLFKVLFKSISEKAREEKDPLLKVGTLSLCIMVSLQFVKLTSKAVKK